jgi:hypothetical protein
MPRNGLAAGGLAFRASSSITGNARVVVAHERAHCSIERAVRRPHGRAQRLAESSASRSAATTRQQR